jgi:hypothetical protein
MNKNNIMACVLLVTIALFIIFNYMPTLIQVSALENESHAFLQLGGKVRELEAKLTKPVVVMQAKSIRARKQLEKQIRAAEAPKKKVIGNRGFLIKEGKPQ